MSYFPFDEYIASTIPEEYSKDLNMRNSIVKYINAILVDTTDCVVPLRKFINVCYFFRNTFCKESFLFYYLNRFDEEERSVINPIIFDIFVLEEKGVIGEHEKFYELSFELYNETSIDTCIKSSWDYVKQEQELLSI